MNGWLEKTNSVQQHNVRVIYQNKSNNNLISAQTEKRESLRMLKLNKLSAQPFCRSSQKKW